MPKEDVILGLASAKQGVGVGSVSYDCKRVCVCGGGNGAFSREDWTLNFDRRKGIDDMGVANKSVSH